MQSQQKREKLPRKKVMSWQKKYRLTEAEKKCRVGKKMQRKSAESAKKVQSRKKVLSRQKSVPNQQKKCRRQKSA